MNRRTVLVVALAFVVALAACTSGPRWQQLPVPPPPAADMTQPEGGGLSVISCPTAAFCLTVGNGSAGAAWNGQRWTAVPLPPEWTADAQPLALSCASARSCLVAESRSLATWHWDGSSWTALPDSQPVGSVALACVAERDCLLLDELDGGGRTRRWRNGVIENLGAGRPAGTSADIACLSPTWCLAVGSAGGHAIAARWDGTTWHDATPTVPVEVDALVGVDCTDVDRCVAIGSHTPPGGDHRSMQIRVLRRSPAGWSPVDASSLPINAPTAVACTTGAACVITGYRFTEGRELVTGLVAADTATPLAGPFPVNTELLDIDCGGTTPRCVAVGRGGVSYGFPRLFEWDGTWRQLTDVPLPTIVSGSTLTRVSCPTAASCVAIGRDTGARETTPAGTSIVERWDGRTWTYAREPGLPGRSGELLAVSCPTTAFCALAGAGTDGSGQRTGPGLWIGEGGSWSRADLGAGAGAGALTGVACTSPSACVAVGPELALRWDGRSWTSIRPGDWPEGIRSVSCWGPDRCVSTVSQQIGSPSHNHLDLWDGRSWTREWQSYTGTWDSPQPGPFDKLSLLDVSCAGDQRCTAVGFDFSNGYGAPVALRRSAAGWVRETVPGDATWLVSVSCVPDGSCVALHQSTPYVLSPQPRYVTTSRQGGPWSTPSITPNLGLAALTCQPGTCIAIGGGHLVAGTRPPDPTPPTAARMTW